MILQVKSKNKIIGWLKKKDLKFFVISLRKDSILIKIRVGLIMNSIGFHRIFPLNAERLRGRNQAKFASIRVNWSPIIAENRLVVRFDWLSGGNLSFN